MELKSTTDSVANIQRVPWTTTFADLRVCRVGAEFRAYSRPSTGAGAWTQRAAWTRADLNLAAGLQCGVMAFSLEIDGSDLMRADTDFLSLAPIASFDDCLADAGALAECPASPAPPAGLPAMPPLPTTTTSFEVTVTDEMHHVVSCWQNCDQHDVVPLQDMMWHHGLTAGDTTASCNVAAAAGTSTATPAAFDTQDQTDAIVLKDDTHAALANFSIAMSATPLPSYVQEPKIK